MSNNHDLLNDNDMCYFSGYKAMICVPTTISTHVETKATYEQIKVYVKENLGMNVSNLYIAQVKREFGIVERTNYNVSVEHYSY